MSITRYRADTYPVRATVRDPDGELLPLTDCSFLLTVNLNEHPVDATDQVFQSIGSVIGPTDVGVVEFPITGTSDAGDYYYDIEMTDSVGKIRTVDYGTYTLLQDITKSDESGVIEFSGETPGESILMDGSGIFYPYLNKDDGGYTYESRDGRVVVRTDYGTGKYTSYCGIGGAAAPFLFLPIGIRIKLRVYIDLANDDVDCLFFTLRDMRSGGLEQQADITIHKTDKMLATGHVIDGNYLPQNPPVPASHPAGWYWLGLEVTKTGDPLGEIWPDGEDEPDPWTVSVPLGGPWIGPYFTCCFGTWLAVSPQASIFDVERIEWERI